MSRKPPLLGAFLVLCFSALASAPLHSQTSQPPPIRWQRGPVAADLHGFATIQVPEGFLFADKKGAQKLLELTQNIPSDAVVGAIVPEGDEAKDQWFVTFEFTDIGFVKDDEKAGLDANKILDRLQAGNEEANKFRKEKGWETLELTGWDRQPYYDAATHNLTWAVHGRSEKGDESVNHCVRILGRRGTMNVDLVMSPDQYAATVPAFDQMLASFEFYSGNRYADFVKGDKVATYGLTALIAGGAGAVAVKTGLLAKSWKLIVGILLAGKKLIVVILLAAGAFIKRIWGAISGRNREEEISLPETAPGEDPK